MMTAHILISRSAREVLIVSIAYAILSPRGGISECYADMPIMPHTSAGDRPAIFCLCLRRSPARLETCRARRHDDVIFRYNHLYLQPHWASRLPFSLELRRMGKRERVLAFVAYFDEMKPAMTAMIMQAI